MEEPFYAKGLNFSCVRCSDCCRHESGFVYLSHSDLAKLCKCSNLEKSEFITMYCRWVPYETGAAALSLREKSNFDCIFWDCGCKVYSARPVQCVTYPFWSSIMSSKDSWASAASACRGIGLEEGQGAHLNETAIKKLVEQYQNNNPILKKG